MKNTASKLKMDKTGCKHPAETIGQISEELYTAFLNSTSDIIFLKDEKFRHVLINKAYEKFLGKNKNEIIGKTDFEILPGTIARNCRKSDLKALELKSIVISEEITGNNIYESRKFRVKLKNGKFGVGGYVRDVTSQKLMKDALKESEQKFKSIFDNASDAIIIADIESKKIFSANKSAGKMFGYSLKEFKDFEIRNLHPEKDLPYVMEQFKKQEKGEITLACNIPVKTKGGSVFYVETNSFFITIGSKKYIAGVFRDITERVKIEIMREKAFREVSHELKTPIAMIEMAQNVNKQAIKNNDMSQIIKTQDIISNNLIRLNKDVNNILDMFVLKRKKVPEKTLFSIRELIDEILRNNQYFLYEKKIRVNIDIPKEEENIFADPWGIKILINNILDNAIKFTDKGFITISVRPKDEFTKIEVKDTGCGISPEIKKNIFTRFFKRHPVVSGTGLGLTISKEIVEMHKGKIEVFSKGEGKGTVVVVYLPKSIRLQSSQI